MSKKKIQRKWNFFETAIWGYSTVLLVILLLFTLLPSGNGRHFSDPLPTIVLFCPLLIFLFVTVFRYKQYEWSLWMTLLMVYAILLLSLMILALVFVGDSAAPSANSSVISFILFLPILVFFVAIGNNQFDDNGK